MLIVLFILIFAILGMSVFGGLSIGSLSETDADGLPYFRPACFLRVVYPGDPTMRTARLVNYNISHYNVNATANLTNPSLEFAPYQVRVCVCVCVCVCMYKCATTCMTHAHALRSECALHLLRILSLCSS